MISASSPAAWKLHRDAIVVDLHSDTLLDVASGKRDVFTRGSRGHIDIPRLREGGVDVQVFAAYIDPREAHRGLARANELLDAFDRFTAANPDLLSRVLTAAEVDARVGEGMVAAVLSIESGDAVQGNPANVDRLYRRGVRIMSLTWNNSTALADGASEQKHGGLTQTGRQVLARMQALGMIIDVSHLSEKSFWDVLGATRGPLIATHSNAAGLTPHARNLSDEQLRALAARGGVVGVNFYPGFTGGPTLTHVLAHVDYLVRTMGVDHVALGSDFDGFTQTVAGLEDVSRLPNLTAGLLARGYPREDIKKILGGNALRVFKQVWKR
ncbi:MAG: membrane dipeptidase [Armatimonadetes bacterium]|nr:membrane dipeptidase [Armatimonadota bacterium]MBI2247856.1 membrane dipeptidase [Armatimonadota bacterium]MBI2972843.1 membrane dipeptidase [Armatimonadota bacterium]